MSRPRTLAALGILLPAVAALGAVCSTLEPPEVAPLRDAATSRPISYAADVKPVLEDRCVVCHGCYDAPCQLLFSSFDGIERGASKQPVYHSDRLTAAEPTRLFVDAHGEAAWRKRGFFSVLRGDESEDPDGTLLRMLALGRANPFTPNERLPASLALDITRQHTCPTLSEFDRYARRSPQGGMPYGMAPLTASELSLLAGWVAQGAPGPPAPPPLTGRIAEQRQRWEAFLNGDSLKERITARYLYEHWFLAHLHFDDSAAGPFFRIVRSKTPPGVPAEEIATRRPYDDPGVHRVWYRLVPIESTIVHKTHILYPLGDAKMRRLTELFLESDWQPTRLPGYGPEEASNPFRSFAEIPPRSRYQYLLDDAQYFVMTFIRGPVCHGQVAVDVIEDHFFVMFLDPDREPSVIDPEYLAKSAEYLGVPGEHGSRILPGEIWLEYNRDQRRYLDIREAAYDAYDPERRGPALDYLWDGDGENRNAYLTVFRNFDNATVVRGFVGEIPETAWVLDYPLLERIYYDLVAAFDVFGNVAHQASTRLYMDHLRMQSENLFLAFLPEDRRKEIRASWYVGATDDLTYALVDTLRSRGHGTQIEFDEPDVKRELIEMIIARQPALTGSPDLLNRCDTPPCDRPDAGSVERRSERALQPLAGVRGKWVAPLPEVTLLRVRDDAPEGGAAVYTLVHNRAHTNVASMFREDDRLEPEKDTITLVRGYLGSYPNFLFDVDAARIEEFATSLAAVAGPDDLESLVARFGVRRTSPRFWETMDWIQEDFRRRQPVAAGLFDLNRYENL